jgi:hypothetical protein
LRTSLIAAIALTAFAPLAFGQTFYQTDDVTYSSSSTVVVAQRNAAMGAISPTVSYGISDAYNGSPIAADFPSSVATGTGGPWNFYDDYVFTVGSGGATIQSALISFSNMFSGINDLQARIIGVNGTFNAAANLGAPASGNTLVDAWINTTMQAGVNTVNLNATPFGPGTYDLQIRGEVLGSPPSGGYGGSVTFTPTPVPLPAALPLLVSGLGLLGGVARRRRRQLAVGGSGLNPG